MIRFELVFFGRLLVANLVFEFMENSVVGSSRYKKSAAPVVPKPRNLPMQRRGTLRAAPTHAGYPLATG